MSEIDRALLEGLVKQAAKEAAREEVDEMLKALERMFRVNPNASEAVRRLLVQRQDRR